MKRRSRGEQMLAAAGITAPAVTSKPEQQHNSELKDNDARSPPAKRARAMVKDDPPGRNPEPDTPKRLVDSAFKLPAELELLASMFDALRTGRMMLKRRSEKVTYNSVRHVVENMTKREFRVEHLAQIKYLRPQAFDWQYIRTPSAANPLQMEVQLLLTFDRSAPSDAEGGDGSVGRYSGASELSDFRAQLEEYAKANPMDPETGKLQQHIPQAPLPPRPAAPGATPSRSGSLPLGGLPSPGVGAVGCAAGLLQAEAQVAGSPAAMRGGMVDASLNVMPRTLFRSGMPPGTVPQPSLGPVQEDGTPAAMKGSVARLQQQVPRAGGQSDDHDVEGEVMLEDDDEEGAAEGASLQPTRHEGILTARQQTPFDGSTAVATTPQSKGPRPANLQTTPTSHQQQSAGLARLHSLLSPAAMQKILQTEAAQAAQTPEAKRRAEMRRAVQLLPHAHDLVRIIFGLQGPTVKPLAQVAQAMCERSTQRQGLTAREASNTLVALARAVPEFLRIEDPRVMADGSARPRSVVISRTATINAIAAKLKQLASDPDVAVSAIFERGSGAMLDPGSRGDSPGCGITGLPPSSPLPGLRPRALAQSLEDEAKGVAATASGCVGAMVVSNSGRGSGGAAACGPGSQFGVTELPPPTPSSRRRPPGLPLPPASPLLARGGQTPTRSSAVPRTDRVLGTNGSILDAQGRVGPGPLPASNGAGLSRATSSVSGADDFLRKLCRAGAGAGETSASVPLAVKGIGDSGGEVAACGSLEVMGKAEQEASGQLVAAGARTPGRTAVQEEMLNSIRRSSAKRTCRKLLVDELEVGNGGGNEAAPLRRRLEDSLVD